MSDLSSYMGEYWAVIHISEMTDCIPVVFPPKTVCIANLLYLIHFYICTFRDYKFVSYHLFHFQWAVFVDTNDRYIKMKNEIGIEIVDRVS